jgi:tetratricopeptide (TPR) repeat protein
LISRRALVALTCVVITACTDSARPPPPAPAPPEAPWPGDGLPGLIPDLEAMLADPGLAPAQRPAALLRLAALKDERARADHEDQGDLAAALAPAIALYDRLLRDHPSAREGAAAAYYLGHALHDADRPLDAARAWRSLVCHDRYPYAGPDARAELPQDHDPAYWQAWEARRAAGKPAPGDEATFIDPFPASCQPMPQETPPGAEPRYLSEVWWRLGESSFDGMDPRGGPFNYARAESAYQRALASARAPIRGVALYKLAWTYFKAERYQEAVRAFIRLLRYADEEQKRTGDPGLDFRAEAVTYIAGALTYVDFIGPPMSAPTIPRPDVLDTEHDPKVAEQKLRVGVDRAQDPALIPQREPWTADIFDALGREYLELNMMHNAILVDEIFLQRWPRHALVPQVLARVVRAHERLAAMAPPGSPEQADHLEKAREAQRQVPARKP